jgi:hypothetical protein
MPVEVSVLLFCDRKCVGLCFIVATVISQQELVCLPTTFVGTAAYKVTLCITILLT